ncbi:FAD-dependent monooxygenase [Sphingobium lactosutens]|uniref:FAD-dependent monooxygenase n=1 Tax=Sphingobium lactosutens TaxID=522773 RepID=UPI00137886B7|nr:FAD-dependent monooxygenase [Sphingobium lactosutens]
MVVRRLVLLGDAVHATTPHLASGAGMAVESAIVLAEELCEHDSLRAGLAAYEARRFDRCRDVIESSLAIGESRLTHRAPQEQAQLLEGALSRLNKPF